MLIIPLFLLPAVVQAYHWDRDQVEGEGYGGLYYQGDLIFTEMKLEEVRSTRLWYFDNYGDTIGHPDYVGVQGVTKKKPVAQVKDTKSLGDVQVGLSLGIEHRVDGWRHGQVYWADWKAAKIQRSNFDGSHMETVMTADDSLENPRSIFVYSKYEGWSPGTIVYIADWKGVSMDNQFDDNYNGKNDPYPWAKPAPEYGWQHQDTTPWTKEVTGVRLAGFGSTKYQGRLEIHHHGQWGAVCNPLKPTQQQADVKTSTQYTNIEAFTSTPPYSLGAINTNSCPSPTTKITSVGECETAAASGLGSNCINGVAHHHHLHFHGDDDLH
jgi:hypothetical protein